MCVTATRCTDFCSFSPLACSHHHLRQSPTPTRVSPYLTVCSRPTTAYNPAIFLPHTSSAMPDPTHRVVNTLPSSMIAGSSYLPHHLPCSVTCPVSDHINATIPRCCLAYCRIDVCFAVPASVSPSSSLYHHGRPPCRPRPGLTFVAVVSPSLSSSRLRHPRLAVLVIVSPLSLSSRRPCPWLAVVIVISPFSPPSRLALSRRHHLSILTLVSLLPSLSCQPFILPCTRLTHHHCSHLSPHAALIHIFTQCGHLVNVCMIIIYNTTSYSSPSFTSSKSAVDLMSSFGPNLACYTPRQSEGLVDLTDKRFRT